MTERDLRLLLDDAADDTGREALVPSAVVMRGRRRRARRRGAVAGGLAAVAVGAVVLGPRLLAPAPVVPVPPVADPTSVPAPMVSPTFPGPGLAYCVGSLMRNGAYYDVVDHPVRPVPLTGRTVEATYTDCNDTGGPQPEPGPPEQVEVIEGISPDVAFLRDGMLFVQVGAHLPASTDVWWEPVGCDATSPTTLTGPWQRYPGRPGHRIVHLWVDSGPLEGYTVPVRDDGSFDPDGPERLTVDVHCEGGEFVGEGFTS